MANQNGTGEVLAFGGNRPLVEALVRASVRFLVVGGSALRLHAPERPIGSNDLDLLVDATLENATRVISALASLGVTGPTLTPERLAQREKTQVRLHTADLFADIITAPGLDFAAHDKVAVDALLFGVPVRVASVETLRLMLADSNEPKHAQDREILDRLCARCPSGAA